MAGTRLFLGTQLGLRVWEGEESHWEEKPGGFAGQVIDCFAGCAREPGTVYLGIAQGGLYRTRDGGGSWEKVFSGDVRAVAVDPVDESTVYLGTEPVHLYRSADGGARWTEIESVQRLPDQVKKKWWFPRPPHQGHVRHIFRDASHRDVIYLALEHGGIIRSLDRGNSWEDVSEGISYLDIHFVTTFPDEESLFFASTARGFYRSNDPAKGWERIENGLTREFCYNIVFFPGDPTVMLLATGDGSPAYWERPGVARSAIYRSLNAARNWETVGGGMPDGQEGMPWTLVAHPADAQTAFAGFGQVSRGRAEVDSSQGWEKNSGQLGAVWGTFDRGQNWRRLPIDTPAVRSMWAAPEC